MEDTQHAPAVIEIKRDGLHWEFHERHSTQAVVFVGAGRWPRQTPVDPFPAYPHDADQVRELARAAAVLFPLDPLPVFYVLPVETPSRTNAWTQYDSDYGEDGKASRTVASIVLQAKRIPPHPAVTRYLVFHEYGHAIEHALAEQQGLRQSDRDVYLRQYAERRGLLWQSEDRYGGGTWHANPGEVFADDFRILVGGMETEFWPHPGIARPEDVPGLREWWIGTSTIARGGR